MGYRGRAGRRSGRVARIGMVALISAQLAGCATARDVTRGAGTAIGAMGAVALLVALDLDCNPDTEFCEDEPDDEDETAEELKTRAIVAAGGGAAVLIGGGLVAIGSVPKKKKRRPPLSAKPAPPVRAASVRPSPHAQSMRALVEKRGFKVSVPCKSAELPALPAARAQ